MEIKSHGKYDLLIFVLGFIFHNQKKIRVKSYQF